MNSVHISQLMFWCVYLVKCMFIKELVDEIVTASVCQNTNSMKIPIDKLFFHEQEILSKYSKYRAHFEVDKTGRSVLIYQQRISFIHGIRPNQQMGAIFSPWKGVWIFSWNTIVSTHINLRINFTSISKTFISFQMASRGLHHRADVSPEGKKINNNKFQIIVTGCLEN